MKRAALVIALGAIAILLLGARVVWSSRVEWRAAQATSGEEEVAHLGRAAQLYAPGNPYSRSAAQKLAAIGRANGPEALAAWRALRTAILGSRSFVTPERALLAEANREIAAEMAAAEPDSLGSPSVRLAWHEERLAEDEAPSVAYSLLALFGLALFLASAFAFFARAIDDDDRLRRRPALLFGLGVLLGLVTLFLGLYSA